MIEMFQKSCALTCPKIPNSPLSQFAAFQCEKMYNTVFFSYPALNLSPIQFVLFDNIKPRDAQQCLGTERVLKSAEWYC